LKLVNPARASAIEDAPNKMKQPIATVIPRRNSSLPENISNPIAATARMATAVAVVPNAALCTQVTPSAIGLPVGGSEREAAAEYIE
jgi:hypothetical protein